MIPSAVKLEVWHATKDGALSAVRKIISTSTTIFLFPRDVLH
jgi:hypothetical protein